MLRPESLHPHRIAANRLQALTNLNESLAQIVARVWCVNSLMTLCQRFTLNMPTVSWRWFEDIDDLLTMAALVRGVNAGIILLTGEMTLLA
jgi:hypothetical protein